MPSRPRKPIPQNSKLDSINDFVAVVQLGNVVVHEERARRIEWSESDLAEREFPSYSNSMGILEREQEIAIRFRMVFTDQSAEYVSDVAAVYTLPKGVTATQDVQLEFAERVAFMAVYPYLRASVYGGAARLGQPIPVLGIVRQGEFSIGDKMPDDAVLAAFGDTESEIAPS